MRYVTNAHCPKEALYNSIRLKTKELLTYHCGCHGNLVTLAMWPNIKSIQLETKELLTYHCGCQGNLVIAMRYVTAAYYSKEAPCQI